MPDSIKKWAYSCFGIERTPEWVGRVRWEVLIHLVLSPFNPERFEVRIPYNWFLPVFPQKEFELGMTDKNISQHMYLENCIMKI